MATSKTSKGLTTKILTIPTYNLTEYANLIGVSYSHLSKKNTGHTLVGVDVPRREKPRYLHPDIAAILEKHLSK